jgi:ribosomal protein S11
MGLTRKILSVSTLGAVDFRSDKERAAAYARTAKRHAKKQTKLLKEQTKLAKKAARG